MFTSTSSARPKPTWGSGAYEQYGPMQIQQPSMFDFKLQLGPYLGHLTAFASGLALFDAGSYNQAIPFFDTAAEVIGQPLAVKWTRAIRFYRGTNFLTLDQLRCQIGPNSIGSRSGLIHTGLRR